MANKIGNASSTQQVNDAQHLDNMTSLQQSAAAEQSPLAQSNQVRGDAPTPNSPTPTPDSPSLFNDPKNPNNKVVEVEPEEGDEIEETPTRVEESGNQNTRSAEELASINNNKLNNIFTVQANGQDGNSQSAAEAAANANASSQNAGSDASVGGGSVSPLIRAKVKTGDASASSSEAQSSESSSSSSSTSSAPASSSASSSSSSSSVAAASSFVTPQAQFIPQAPVTNVNEAPTITSSATASFAENATGTVYTATATDPDASTTLSYSLSGADAALFNIDSSTGVVTFKAAPNYEAPGDAGGNNVYDINVIASDGTLTASKAVTLAITNLDESAPSITSGAVATALAENSGANQVVYTASSSDADYVSGSTSYSLAGTDASLFSINSSTGAVTLTGNPNFESKPSYSFTVVATDAAGNASNQAVTLAITNLDESAPSITSGAVATALAENSGANQVVYTASSSDADYVSGSTSYSLAGTDASLFSINSSTGAVTLTGNPNFESKPSYSFTVVATDAAGNASNQAVTLAITNLDESAPSITSGAVATALAENSGANQVVYTASSSDADYVSGSTSYSLAGTDASLFSINSSTGAVTLTGNPNFESKPSYSFTVVATDAAGNASNQAVTLAITNLDESAPSITSGAVATALAENSGANQVVYTASSSDADYVSGSTSYSLAGTDASLFSINSSTGAVTLTGNPNFESKPSYSFTVVATDAAGNASNQAVTLAITNLDESAPSITSGAVATALAENSGANQVVYTASSSDADYVSGSTSYSLAGTDASLFSINSSTGAVTLTGNPNFESKPSYSFTVVATDAAGNASNQAVTLAITNLDESAPSITSGAVATALAENSGANQVVYTASSSDADYVSGSTSYSLAGTDASLFSINSSTGAVTLTGNPNFESKPSYSFTVVATDAAGNASNQAVTLAITNLDESAPSITSGAVATALAENSGANQVVYTASSSDADYVSGSTSYSLAGTDASLFSINSSTGAVTLTGNPNFESKPSYSFTVVATDAAGNASNQAVTLAITNLDESAPSITSGAVATALAENSGANQVVYTASSSDADYVSGSTSYSLAGTDASLFSINSSTGAVTLTGNPNFESKPSYSFTVVATDAAGNASNQAVTLAITNLDESAPSITSGAVATALAENSGANQVVYTASSSDADYVSGSTSYSLAGTDASLFSINSSTGAVTLTGNPNFESKPSYSFTVVATDAAGNASNQAVTLAITNLDESAPSITSGAVATALAENSGANQVVYTASSSDADYVSGSTSYSLAGTDASLFSINSSTGAVTLTGNPNFESKPSYSFTVVATDAAGNASNQAVTLAITNLDESAPSITSGAVATALAENSGANQVVYTASSSDADYVSGSTSYSLAGTDASLFSINSSTGAVTLTGNPNFESKPSYSFTVVATDAAGNASNQAVTLAITNLDESAPSITSGAVATALAENSGANQVVYTASSSDADYVSGSTSYSLAGTDASLFSINSSTGAVTLTGNPNFESKPSYSFTVVATDAAGNASNQAVTLAITNLDESAPSITSGAVATALAENSGANQVVYTASSSDADYVSGSTSYSLAGTDASLFSINSSTGAVTLTGNPNFESKPSYSFTVVATDAAGNASNQAVTLAITNLDESAPSITSGAVATALAENSGANQVVYTASSSDADYVSGSTSYSLAGTDASLFSINSSTGAVTLTGNPNFESKPSYNFTVVATDAAGNASNQAVTLAITDVNEAPTITSSATTSFAENAAGTVYTATAADPDASTTLSYSLSGADANLFNINSSTGAVTFKVVPNYESPSDAGANNVYNISVIASDGALSSSQAVAITVTNVNEVPTFSATSGVLTIVTNVNTASLVLTGGEGILSGYFTDPESSQIGLDATPTIIASSISSLSATSTGASLVGTVGNITMRENTGALDGSFSIVATDGVNSSTAATVNLNNNIASVLTLNAEASGDSIIYNAQTSAGILNGGSGNDYLIGNTGADTLSGGLGNDKLVGGNGADTMTGGAGADTFIINVSNSTSVLAAPGNSGTITGYDVIKDFDTALDTLDLQGAPTVATDTVATNGANSTTYTIAGATVKSHAISNGIITFDDADSFASPLSLTSLGNVAAVLQYLQANDLGNANTVVAFTATISSVAHTYIYEQLSAAAPGTTATNSLFVDLEGVTITNLSTLVGTRVTPIAIDLNGDGIQYQSLAVGIAHDYENSGHAVNTSWVSAQDGLLALKLAGEHNVDITFATQAGETDLEGLAKVYDTNFDKVLDAKDSGFNDFGVWQDADSDGVVDAGEFLSLADRGIISLSLTSDGIINTAADGDVLIYGQTTYTMTDGSLGIAEDVAFAVSDANQNDGNGVQDVYQIASVANSPLAIDDFNVDEGDFVDLSAILNPTNTVQSTIAIDADGFESSHSTITVNIGGVDYEVATLYGKELGVGDVLADHAGGASLTDSLNGADWTDVVDISSEHGGPASISEAGGLLTNTYSNEGGDWTVQIKSGTATVDAANKEINFTSDNAENLAIITTADGTLHEISNVDKILWR